MAKIGPIHIPISNVGLENDLIQCRVALSSIRDHAETFLEDKNADVEAARHMAEHVKFRADAVLPRLKSEG